jgi:hypothetical protein
MRHAEMTSSLRDESWDEPSDQIPLDIPGLPATACEIAHESMPQRSWLCSRGCPESPRLIAGQFYYWCTTGVRGNGSAAIAQSHQRFGKQTARARIAHFTPCAAWLADTVNPYPGNSRRPFTGTSSVSQTACSLQRGPREVVLSRNHGVGATESRCETRHASTRFHLAAFEKRAPWACRGWIPSRHVHLQSLPFCKNSAQEIWIGNDYVSRNAVFAITATPGYPSGRRRSKHEKNIRGLYASTSHRQCPGCRERTTGLHTRFLVAIENLDCSRTTRRQPINAIR